MFLRKVKFTRLEFDEALRPAVYAAMRGGVPLYIGFSRNGYRRVFAGHDAPGGKSADNRSQAFKECDEVVFRFYSDEREAKIAEADLIFKFKPRYNTRGVKGKSELKWRYNI